LSVVLPLADNGLVFFLVAIDIEAFSSESLDKVAVLVSLNGDELEKLTGLAVPLVGNTLGSVIVAVLDNGQVSTVVALDGVKTHGVLLESELLVVSSVVVPDDGVVLGVGGLGHVKGSSGVFTLE